MLTLQGMPKQPPSAYGNQDCDGGQMQPYRRPMVNSDKIEMSSTRSLQCSGFGRLLLACRGGEGGGCFGTAGR
jgi:hypothetical protein